MARDPNEADDFISEHGVTTPEERAAIRSGPDHDDSEPEKSSLDQRLIDYTAMTAIANHLRNSPAHPYSGRQCEEHILFARDQLYSDSGRLHKLERALILALIRLGKLEPGDSRAVSNEYVAMAAISCDIPDNRPGECLDIIEKAILAEDIASE